MKREDVIIIGAGPCGLSAAIACQNKGLNTLVIEKENVVHSIYRYPTHQTFFSTSEKLEIGGVAFLTEERKPRRNQALVYYRDVVKRKEIRINKYERVLEVKKRGGLFNIRTSKGCYESTSVIVATGYYDSPNMLHIPGENLSHVHHYFKEAHPYFDMDVVVIGGKNSAVDASLELQKAGARVTNLYRGNDYSTSVKPWILPEFDSLVRNNSIQMEFNAEVTEITKSSVVYKKEGKKQEVIADVVFAMTGYHPDHSFIQAMGVNVDVETGRPYYNPETMETNINGLYIAGVIAAGNNANEIFIENGRFHGEVIANHIIS
ncbi:YpdA family putative bacillithiol disulfide reductase [Alkalihalobacillus hemicellulosilyticus]|uniref:Thioredoxin reductase n=1 Tax=Halalkalibacter hemicellulosilyticusJCM 9152 TaxID=1236971 RepID=W4QAB5_9BACI|nr:YpdA family putative bacillithiol disulfide reductase [Halalkalibacter hemicellulosilyticus]GAE28986.1 thioredoxin reductase [Halalkalibacter hemicellulosilyticusJCM 9152]